MALGRSRKTGTVDDVVEAARPMGISGDRQLQDEYLPAVDDALSNLPKKDRRRAGPVVAGMILAFEAKRLDLITHEGYELTLTKLRALVYQLSGARNQPEAVLAPSSASQMANTVRKVADQYEEVYFEEHGM